jgi:hypothetical protein
MTSKKMFHTKLFSNTRWFKYDRDWFVCKQAAQVPVIFEPPCTRWFKYDRDWFFFKNHNCQTLTCTCQCGLFTHKSVPVIFESPCIFQHFSLTTVNLGSCYVGSFMLMACSYHSEHDTGLPSKDLGEYYLTLTRPVGTVIEVSLLCSLVISHVKKGRKFTWLHDRHLPICWVPNL